MADTTVPGISDALVAQYPELAEVRRLYLAGDTGGATRALKATGFYRNLSATAAARLANKVEKPGAYEAELENEWLPVLREYAVSRGFKVSDGSLTAAARKAYDLGLSIGDAQTLNFVEAASAGIAGGTASQARTSLAEFSAAMGVSYTPDYFDAAANAIARGDATIESFQDDMRAAAKGKYQGWAKQIDAGLTVKQIASPYMQSMASILELNPNEIGLDDQALKFGLNSADKDGNLVPMNLYDFEKSLRRDPRWQYTKNARDSYSNMAMMVMQRFGIAG